jgi:hypothetical protein
LIIRILFGEEYNHEVPYYVVFSTPLFLLGPNIFLSTLFSNTLDVYFRTNKNPRPIFVPRCERPISEMILTENRSRYSEDLYHFVHHRVHVDWWGLEPRLPWRAANCLKPWHGPLELN